MHGNVMLRGGELVEQQGAEGNAQADAGKAAQEKPQDTIVNRKRSLLQVICGQGEGFRIGVQDDDGTCAHHPRYAGELFIQNLA